MQRHLFITLLCLIVFSISYAQRRGGYGGNTSPTIKGKVTGKLVDEGSGEGIEFATVSIKSARDSSVVNGTLTEIGGSFRVNNLPNGKYLVEFSFLGYEVKTEEINLTPKSPDANMGDISLQQDITALEAVTIEGERQVIESRIDKIVYNADQDIGNAGGDATDVLRRTPLLSVDLEGNVSLRGSQNIQILVNGKPSTMFSGNVGDALSSIPADQIKSVEVITSPSAKYDGEGSAGIINIITKKSGPEGFKGNTNLSIGNLQNRGSLGLAMGRGRFGLNLNGSSYWSVPRDATSTLYREDRIADDLSILTEDGTQESFRIGFFGNAGAFYDFNAYHSITSSFRLRGFRSGRDGNFFTTLSAPQLQLNQQYDRYTDNDVLFSGYEWSLDYIMKFPQNEGRELALSYKIDGNVQDQRSVITQQDLLGDDPSLFRDEINENDGNNREDTYQADYVHPLNSKIKIEAGAKAIIRNVDSDFTLDSLNSSTGSYELVDNRSDLFIYDQDVYAGYLSTTMNLTKNFGIIAGARYETTAIKGSFRDVERPFENTYENLLPSITVSQKLKNFQTIKLSYTRRIQRPGLRQINPFIIIDNNRFISYGNPELDPEITDQYEISYGKFKKGTSINVSFYFRYTDELIESIRLSTNNEVSETTFLNIGNNQSFGLNLFSSSTFFKIWTIRGGVNVFTYNATGSLDGNSIENSAILFNANGSSSVKINDNWTFEGFGFYRARRQTIQGYNPSFSIWSLAIQRKFLKDQGKIGFRVIEPLVADKSFGSELSGETFYQMSDFVIPFRSFGITFSYEFGKLDFRQRERRSRIRNDDQKAESQNEF
jgi:outer membrane receptor protein involved in Fe transport